jgi:hypothetical protein
MIERTIEMQAMVKQAEVLAWASEERQADEAERARQGTETLNRRSMRAAIAGMLVALAAWLVSTDTAERGATAR